MKHQLTLLKPSNSLGDTPIAVKPKRSKANSIAIACLALSVIIFIMHLSGLLLVLAHLVIPLWAVAPPLFVMHLLLAFRMNKKGNQASPLSSSGRSKMQRIVYLVIVYAMSLGLIFTAFTSVITSTTYTVLRVPGFDSCSVAVRESSFLLQSKGDLYEELLPSVYHKSRNWEVNNGARVISRGEFTFDRDTYFTYLELGTAATTQVSPSIFALECE